MTSTDGRAWTAPLDLPGYPITNMIFDGTSFVAVAGVAVLRSTDAITWSAVSTPGSTEVLAYDGTELVGSGPGGAFTSTDSGATWGSLIPTPLSYDVYATVGAAGVTIASGFAAATVFTTGGAWERAVVLPGGLLPGGLRTTFYFGGAAAIGSRYVMVGTDGAIVYKDYP
jgi:hypothetical protein